MCIHVFIQELIMNWKSLLYHITGVHSWIEEGKPKKCGHNDLSPKQQQRTEGRQQATTTTSKWETTYCA